MVHNFDRYIFPAAIQVAIRYFDQWFEVNTDEVIYPHSILFLK
jgi:hypothetical protein